MVEPTGYTALDLIGFTDKGPYDPTANYVKNDLVHVGNSTWRCKIDDTTGITPTEGANWTIFIESATSLAGMSDVDLNTPKAGDGLVHDGNDWTNIPIMTKEQWQKNGAYNLCGSKYTTEVDNGITFTANSDGSVTTSGSVGSGRTYSILIGSQFTLKAGTYVLGFNPVTGAGGRHTAITLINAGTSSVIKTIDTLEKDTFTLASDVTCYAQLVCYGTGESYSVTFKPMITTDLNATYADYVPYAKTNRELTEDVTDIFKSKGKIAYSSLNSPFNTSSYSHGIDYKKVGNLLYITGHAELSSATFNANTAYTITTLPVGFRPYIVHRIAPFFTNGYNAIGDNGMQISIGSDGSIQLFGASSVTFTGALWFNAVLFTSAT